MSPVKAKQVVTPPTGKPFKEAVPPLHEVRNSPIHGRGVFAARQIRKGARILEYLGDRITHKVADKRYEDHDPDNNHTFLFIVDKNTVLDAEIGGNDARWINHSCDGNCDSVIENGRVFIEARRAIAPGVELGYDYEIGREKDDPENVDEIFACRCGSPKCRGTMLWPPNRETFERQLKAKAKRAAEKRKQKGRKGKKGKATVARSGSKAKTAPKDKRKAKRSAQRR